MNDQLKVSDLPEEALALFRHVLRSEACLAQVHADQMGWSQARATAAVNELLGLGLVRIDESGLVNPLDPRVSIGRLLERAEADLDAERSRVADMRESISDFERDFRQGQQLSGPALPLFEEVTAEHAPEVVAALDRVSQGPVLQVTGQIESGPGHDPAVSRLRRDSLIQGRAVRSIFSVEVLEHPSSRAIAQARAAAGEQQRFLVGIPMRFAVFGNSGVLMNAGEDSVAEFLLLRSEALVESFTLLFYEMWRRAEPLEAPTPGQDVTRIMELMALGFKDEAIARHLGVGLRTVRRRIADEMDKRGVETRFQLGLAAGRSGVIDAARS